MFNELYHSLLALTDKSCHATRTVRKLAEIEAQRRLSTELTAQEMDEIRDCFTRFINNDIEALHQLIAVKDRLAQENEQDIKADIDWLLRGKTFKQFNHELNNKLTRQTVHDVAKGASIRSKSVTIKDFLR
ncbi:hypothetical protein [Vibrio sp. 10N.261.46.A3]|uniref:hypothetical protein n=1 Tax=Vibrio sp. 10N.261.46.A3 TaxID=3229658 RepID=UPI0035508C8F